MKPADRVDLCTFLVLLGISVWTTKAASCLAGGYEGWGDPWKHPRGVEAVNWRQKMMQMERRLGVLK